MANIDSEQKNEELFKKLMELKEVQEDEKLRSTIKSMFFPPPQKPVSIEELFASIRANYEKQPPERKRILAIKRRWQEKRKEETKRRKVLKRELPIFERFLVELAIKKWVAQEYAGCGTPIKEIAKKTGLSASKVTGVIRLLGIKRARPAKACDHDPDMLREWATKYPKWGTSMAELELDKLLRIHFPRQWRYVSDWQVSIGGKCPDFVHVNQQLIIEMFGEWPHLWLKQRHEQGLTKEKAEQERVGHFAAHGYQTLIIWSKELKNEAQVVQKIREFVRGADVTRAAD